MNFNRLWVDFLTLIKHNSLCYSFSIFLLTGVHIQPDLLLYRFSANVQWLQLPFTQHSLKLQQLLKIARQENEGWSLVIHLGCYQVSTHPVSGAY